MEQPEQTRVIMRRDLMVALKAKGTVATAVIRSALAAMDNAEAPPIDHQAEGAPPSEHVAGSAVGPGAAEIERRQLTDAELRAVIEAGIAEWPAATTTLTTSVRKPSCSGGIWSDGTI